MAQPFGYRPLPGALCNSIGPHGLGGGPGVRMGYFRRDQSTSQSRYPHASIPNA